MRAALYIRVSTDRQAEEGYSLDSQLDRLTVYCESQGWTVVEVYTEEGESAKTTNRPQLQRLLSDVREELVDVVVVWRLDRLTRRVVDLYALIDEFAKHNVFLRSATETFDTSSAIGRLMRGFIAMIAEWERENLAERTKAGQIEMTKQGKWSGGNAPFGYRYVDESLVVEESEADIIRQIFERYIAGTGTMKLIHWLNDPLNPKLGPTGGRWRANALKYILHNPMYAGYVRYGYKTSVGRKQENPIIAKGTHPVIVDEVTFQRAEDIRLQRRTLPARSGTGSYALTGILYCGLCGYAMSGRTSYRDKTSREVRRHYVCTERSQTHLCTLPMTKESILEGKVLEAISERYKTLSQNADVRLPQSNTSNRVQSIERQRKRISEAKQRFMDGYGKGDLTGDDLREQLNRISEQDKRLELELLDITSGIHAELNIEAVLDILRSFPETWNAGMVPERKEMIRMIIKEIRVMPGPELNIEFL